MSQDFSISRNHPYTTRRRVGLTGLLVMAVGILGSVLAWNYGTLLACRLLTGVGAAMIPPNGMAAIADHFPPAQRGRPMSILISASFLGTRARYSWRDSLRGPRRLAASLRCGRGPVRSP